MSQTMAPMRPLGGDWYWADRKTFLAPGLYKGSRRVLALPSSVRAQPELVEFGEQTVVYAKDQPQYRPLPAHRHGDDMGRITFCWRVPWSRRLKLLLTGRLWHQVCTFGNPLQPQLLLVDKPEMKKGDA